MRRMRAKTNKRATFSDELDRPRIGRSQSSSLHETFASEDLAAVETSRVFWRSGTSFSGSDVDDDEKSGDDGTSVLVLEPTSTKAESLRKLNRRLFEVPLLFQKSYTVVASRDNKKTDVYVEVDLEKYMAAREMTPLQERMNALTMIPPPLFCLCFLLSGSWINKALLAEAMQDMEVEDMSLGMTLAAFEANGSCVDWSKFPLFGWMFENLHALPPLPLFATILGVVVHAPWSFLYHWKYAHTLSPTKRSAHWSRRMDQSMLHVSSALTTFGTSGAWDFFLVNVIFNADCIYRQFQNKVIPKRNQGRLGAAIVAWTIPLLRRGEIDMFFQVIITLAVGIFLFVRYPIGGWSHAAFHVVLLPLMPLIMEISTNLPSTQGYLREAAQCYVLAEHRNTFSLQH